MEDSNHWEILNYDFSGSILRPQQQKSWKETDIKEKAWIMWVSDGFNIRDLEYLLNSAIVISSARPRGIAHFPECIVPISHIEGQALQ